MRFTLFKTVSDAFISSLVVLIQLGENLPDPEDAWPLLEEALKESLSKLLEMRSTEGAH